jgi:hypothetical protein
MPTTPYTCPRCGAVSQSPDDAEHGYCGRCHAFTAVSLRIRLFIGGELADEQWVHEPEGVELIGAEHTARAQVAERAGQRWLVEIWDATAPPEEAYLRFGTDEAGMHAPLRVERWPWDDGESPGRESR